MLRVLSWICCKSQGFRYPEKIRVLTFSIATYRLPVLRAVPSKSGIFGLNEYQKRSFVVTETVEDFIGDIQTVLIVSLLIYCVGFTYDSLRKPQPLLLSSRIPIFLLLNLFLTLWHNLLFLKMIMGFTSFLAYDLFWAF